jgi:hypothetical protein
MIQQSRTAVPNLVFDYVPSSSATSKDSQGTPLSSGCEYHGDVTPCDTCFAQGESLDFPGVNRSELRGLSRTL